MDPYGGRGFSSFPHARCSFFAPSRPARAAYIPATPNAASMAEATVK